MRLNTKIILAIISSVSLFIAIYMKYNLEQPKNELLEEQIELTIKKDGTSHKVEKRRYK